MLQTIVIGSLNTDIVATGLTRFPNSGEHIYGKHLYIGPGGKSRNIAEMIARLSQENTVAMVGRTIKDSYGFWEKPVTSLIDVTVDTSYIKILEANASSKLPGIALIPVTEAGENQIIVLPGISDDFSPADIDDAKILFEEVASNEGVLVITMECPLDTLDAAIKMANLYSIKVIFDPGGIRNLDDIQNILNSKLYLIKPNEHEVKIITGIDVVDEITAQQAADKLFNFGIKNVMITLGEQGAYLINETDCIHIQVPDVVSETDDVDSTGCGDQAMATLVAMLQDGNSLTDSAAMAIKAATLQFHKLGIKPVELSEL